jgi:ABC-type sulfate/molybdate transport systems ATPase subunit
MTLLTVSGISRQGESNFALKDVSFSQRKLQKIAIAGETGSGKSTLLKIIAGLVQPDEGEIVFEGEKVTGPNDNLVPGHKGISYLSQHFELPRFLRIEQILAYANTLSDVDAALIYEVCEITHLLQRKTDQLSGGERQRIALAKLLTASPKLLLLDEPFTNLDIVHKNTLKSVIQNIGKKLKITCILISHDPIDTLSWADQILVMQNGQIIQKGTPEKIYRQPVNEYVAGLFGKYTLLKPAYSKDILKLIDRDPKGKSIFARPENFKITTKSKRTVAGIINRISFCGSYYEVSVTLGGDNILITTGVSTFKAGDKVQVLLSDFFLL